LKAHDDELSAVEGLKAALGREVTVVVLENPTRSQPETVAETLVQTGLKEPFLVKDSDNTFQLDGTDQDYNFVSVASLHDFDMINARNKSYVQVDHSGVINTIREKQVISDLFSVGGYYFKEPAQFLEAFRELDRRETEWGSSLYISDVVSRLIMNGTPFLARRVSQYEDWGTVAEWRAKLLEHKAFLISLDGFLLKRASEHFRPRYGEADVHLRAVEAVRSLVASGHKVVFLSSRSRALSQLTEHQLARVGLDSCPVVYDVPEGRLRLVTAAHPVFPISVGDAQEFDPDDDNLLDRLLAN
jgi:hypothetical protein